MKKFLSFLVAILIMVPSILAENPKREMRSVWFTTHQRIDWPTSAGTSTTVVNKQKKELTDYLDRLKARNFNGICFQVRALCDAVYQSSYEPFSGVISGTRGTYPGWDPLAFAVEECHKRGMECYAWINPFRQRTKASNYTTNFDIDLANKGWLLNQDNYYVLNPAIKEAREYNLKVIKEIYTKYAIDGMLFDDYFYPNNLVETSAAGDYKQYKASGTTMSIGDWRRENINSFMRELRAMVDKDRPDMRFGLGPAGVAYLGGAKYGITKPAGISTSDWQYITIYSDPIAWLAEGSIDFLAPQIYWPTTHSSAPYEPLAKFYSEVCHRFNRHFYSSQASYRLNDGMLENNTAGWAEMVKQININRKYNLDNAPGTIWYSAKYFDGPTLTGLGQYLYDNVQNTPALAPKLEWKNRPSYAAPSGLSYSSGTLKWTATTGARSNSIVRYTVYAIPNGTSITAAKNSDGDGFDIKYLVDVTYTNSITIPSAKRSGYWYAVCMFDGYGYESEPGTYGYSQGESQATTLVSPINGAQATWSQQFKWSAVSNATYTIEIATDQAFSNVVMTQAAITTNNVTLDLDPLKPSTTHYWRVTTTQEGKIGKVSSVATFKSPALLAGIVPTLTSPANNADFTGGNIQFAWNKVTDATSYTLNITNKATNATTTTTLEGNTNQVDIAASRLGIGEYSWSVTVAVPHHNDGTSQVRNFSISSLDIGQDEKDYQIKVEDGNYSKTDHIQIQNLWTRRVDAPFSNMSFEENGVLNRGMVISGNYVYVSGRNAVSANADLYIARYNLLTGERMSDLALDESGRCSYLPCNDVVKDSKGNVCITNLSLNSSHDIMIHLVNEETGELTQKAQIPCSARIDHLGIYGDVKSSQFYVFAVGSKSNTLYRWTISNGNVASTLSKTTSTYAPSTAADFGIAPKVRPISATQAYVDGGNTSWALYDFSTGALKSSTASLEFFSKSVASNGGCTFQLGTNHYHVYSYTDVYGSNGDTFAVTKGSTADLASQKLLFTIPKAGLGTANSTTASAPVDFAPLGEKKGIIVIYSPANGLAAYQIEDTYDSAVKDITAGNRNVWLLTNRTIDFGQDVQIAQAYTLNGQLVASSRNASQLTLPAPGQYIIFTPGKTQQIVVR